MNYRAARESTKLITSYVGGNIFPDPFDKQFFQPFTQVRGQSNASQVVFSFRNGNFVEGYSKLFLVALRPGVRGEAKVE